MCFMLILWKQYTMIPLVACFGTLITVLEHFK